MFRGPKVIVLSQRATYLSVCVLNYVSVEFVYVYGCLSVWMAVCVCDRLSAYVSGLISVSVRLPNYMVLVSVNDCPSGYMSGLICQCFILYRPTVCLYLNVSVWPDVHLCFCLFVCVYVCISIRMTWVTDVSRSHKEAVYSESRYLFDSYGILKPCSTRVCRCLSVLCVPLSAVDGPAAMQCLS